MTSISHVVGILFVGLVVLPLLWHGMRKFSRYLRGVWQRWRQRYECMGFDVRYRDINGVSTPMVTSCDRKLKRSELHVVADQCDDSELSADAAEGGLGASGIATLMVRETCGKHCIGSCNKGCEVKSENQTAV